MRGGRDVAATGPGEASPLTDRLVVVGASAGGLEALQQLVAGLPADLPAAVLVAVHLQPSSDSALPKVLARAGALPAAHPRTGEALRPGSIVVAPPDQHLLVHDSKVRLSRGPRENRQRPAIDALFRSAAAAYGPGVVAVVLSGALDDGAVGAAAVAAQDGVVLVQDPDEARVTGMPRAALAAVRRARALPAAALGPAVADLVRRPVAERGGVGAQQEGRVVMEQPPTATSELGTPAALGCPECQGGMFESAPDGAVIYTCHVGHAWSAQTLLDAERQSVEGAIYNAASKLLEMAAVHRRLAQHAERGDGDPGEHLRAAEAAEERSRRIQELATEDPGPD
ncbi:chemotaxis protein CheB [Petropleomorpha daqingensis]|uniref:protein-glutamate methylesterase n=1 Tax=Petropleomorpha daqingensis TaxID=2026353 RepID=A0A853CBF4_9ACTN|nr:chemotaxis protein CheB [Petropleomorpha daqingensis]NYJ05325.1 two-component system chemotaxis response regulator CheB [Petropleomorpha daqingensis]